MCSDVQNSHFLPYFLLSTLAKGSLKSPLRSCPHLVFSNLVHAQTNGTYVVVARLARALIRGGGYSYSALCMNITKLCAIICPFIISPFSLLIVYILIVYTVYSLYKSKHTYSQGHGLVAFCLFIG